VGQRAKWQRELEALYEPDDQAGYIDPELERIRKKRWEAEDDRKFRICLRVVLTASGFVVGSSTSWDVLIVLSLVALAVIVRYPEFI
jgi:hypothetical protein